MVSNWLAWLKLSIFPFATNTIYLYVYIYPNWTTRDIPENLQWIIRIWKAIQRDVNDFYMKGKKDQGFSQTVQTTKANIWI